MKAREVVVMCEEKAESGRPTEYEEKYNDMAYQACSRMGATDKDLAKLFNVCERTINYWKHKQPLFLQSIKDGKDEFNVAVAEECLIKRLKGYEYEEKHTEVVIDKEGVPNKDEDGKLGTAKAKKIVKKTVTKHYPPDVGALTFFLKNRDHTRWRDMKAVELTGKGGEDLKTQVVVYMPSNGRDE